ncbi:hypothetical protein SAMN05444266_103173 [Chitinophaga jiangningensis]|uniref:Carboxypeptidase regulatory-like domain-containing protein n=1 Tax=Chitinophaga jiangningensis TaxID=1419482 RepID=A0A1M7A900_9BACT|nr:hypothetical protein [Chitinophaga jiangningensis]SHL39096.1 hypothetical protein SAMN05444266_103173 [Chitinophaga jiangningensis]
MLVQSIRPFALLLALSLFANRSEAQSKFDTKLLTPGKYNLTCFAIRDGGETEIGNFSLGIKTSADQLLLDASMVILGVNEPWLDTAVSDLQTFKPVYRASHSGNKDLVLHFGNEVTGIYLDKKTGKQQQIKENGSQYFVDSYTYPYLLALLPLASGYTTQIPVYEYKPENKHNVKQAEVEQVKSNTFVSKYTGTHPVWEVTVVEPATNERSVTYIDKDTRRIWQIDIYSNGQQLKLVDLERDYNPVKASFDKVATMKMIKNGNSLIVGEVFARDFDTQDHSILGKMKVNANPKQFAPKGTRIVLIPYTAYYQEWLKVNQAARKKGNSPVPLPDDVADCIKTTDVYDDKGHFEFVNLMPGEYMLYTQFDFDHTYTQAEVVGYTDHYLNGVFQNTTTDYVNRSYRVDAGAAVQKVVKIEKAGDKLEVKLKKTHN